MTFLFVPFALFLFLAPPSLQEFLQQKQWKNRILLVYTPTTTSSAWQQQRVWLSSDPAGLAERDLVIRELPASQLNQTDKSYLQRQLGLDPDVFQVMLIGKDGGVKVRQSTPISLQTLFHTIDGMYMRQQEIKNRKG